MYTSSEDCLTINVVGLTRHLWSPSLSSSGSMGKLWRIRSIQSVYTEVLASEAASTRAALRTPITTCPGLCNNLSRRQSQLSPFLSTTAFPPLGFCGGSQAKWHRQCWLAGPATSAPLDTGEYRFVRGRSRKGDTLGRKRWWYCHRPTPSSLRRSG